MTVVMGIVSSGVALIVALGIVRLLGIAQDRVIQPIRSAIV